MPKLDKVKKDTKENSKKGFDSTYILVGVGVLFLFGILYLIFFIPPAGPAVGGNLADNDPFKGPVDAKVVVVEFSDFQCPACGQMYPIVKRLSDEYSATVKFVYRDFPLTTIHPFAQKAAEAAQCAFDQNNFWNYHDKLFENQQSLQIADLKKYAGEVGLDQAVFDQCLDSGKNVAEVKADSDAAVSAGATGTPTFFVNNRKYQPASYEQFKQVLDAELAKSP